MARTNKPMQIYVDEEIRKAVEELAKRMDRTITAEVRRAIEFYLANPQLHTAEIPKLEQND